MKEQGERRVDTKKDRTTYVIGVGNQKGGVAKTTNTIHIATALGELGKRCLIIDLDSNHGATSSFGIEGSAWQGTQELLLGAEEPSDLVLTAEDEDINLPKNVHLIPATRALEGIDTQLRERFGKFVREEQALQGPIEKLRGQYDYVFLDTGPNASTPTLAAYACSDWFLLSATPEPMAVENLGDALNDIQDAQKNANPKLKLLGVVLSAANRRTNISKRLIEFVDDIFRSANSTKFNTVISRATAIPDAQGEGKTLFETEPAHKVAEEYRALAREIDARLVELTKVDMVLPPESGQEAVESHG